MANIHDIGKITIPEKILNKPGELNGEEWELLKTHPANGAEIAAAEYIKAHHER
jgi:HD-GYP domain-containing protein (c-di-GMP phosphodiesterase class II)